MYGVVFMCGSTVEPWSLFMWISNQLCLCIIILCKDQLLNLGVMRVHVASNTLLLFYYVWINCWTLLCYVFMCGSTLNLGVMCSCVDQLLNLIVMCSCVDQLLNLGVMCVHVTYSCSPAVMYYYQLLNLGIIIMCGSTVEPWCYVFMCGSTVEPYQCDLSVVILARS